MNIFDSNLLENKKFIVSGASSGLGKAVAQLLAKLGGQIVVLGRNEERLNNTFSSLYGGGHHILLGDISSADSAFEIMKIAHDKFGYVDGIFHGAGAISIRLARLTKNNHIDEVIGASLLGAIGIARAAGTKDFFSKSGGSIVFMSSVAGERGQIGMSTYGASRAAITGLVKNLACEFAEKRIRVNSIIAGAIKTEMHDQISKAMGNISVETYRNKHLLGFGKPDDIANCAVFLLSDATKWITGTNIPVDGGYMVR